MTTFASPTTTTTTPTTSATTHPIAEQDASNTTASVATDANAPIDVKQNSDKQADESINADTPSGPTFADLPLAPAVQDAVAERGYTTPSPIQAQAIPHLLEGRDVLGQAQTGTGKTAAFALPLLSRIDNKQFAPQVLTLAPTRELALQVAESFEAYGKNMPRLRVASVYGGAAYGPQLRALREGSQVIVGTPGRVMDHIKKGSMDLSQLKAIVLDEADEMLRMGFIDDVEWILSHTPEEKQVALFSATMPGPIKKIANTYLKDAAEVAIKSKQRTADTVRQRYWMVDRVHKLDCLSRILETQETDGVMVFVRTKESTVEVADQLANRGFKATAINGDMPQQQREQTVERLKQNKLDILVATDVAARGLDVDRISHVINYDVPFDSESYIHRIGRTGRAGRTGEAILFIARREKRFLYNIERATKKPIEEMPLPTADEVNAKRIERFKKQLLELAQQESQDDAKHNEELAMFETMLLRMTQTPEQIKAERQAVRQAKLANKKKTTTTTTTDRDTDTNTPAAATENDLSNTAQDESSQVTSDDTCSSEQAPTETTVNEVHSESTATASIPTDANAEESASEPAPQSEPAPLSEPAPPSALRLAAAMAVMLQNGKPFLIPSDPSAHNRAERRSGKFGDDRHGRPSKFDREPRGRFNDGPRGGKPEFAPTSPKGFDRYRIEVGKQHGAAPKNIVGAIANEAGIRGSDIRNLRVLGGHSFLDLPSGMPKELFFHLKNKVFVSGQPLNISRDTGAPAGRDYDQGGNGGHFSGGGGSGGGGGGKKPFKSGKPSFKGKGGHNSTKGKDFKAGDFKNKGNPFNAKPSSDGPAFKVSDSPKRHNNDHTSHSQGQAQTKAQAKPFKKSGKKATPGGRAERKTSGPFGPGRPKDRPRIKRPKHA